MLKRAIRSILLPVLAAVALSASVFGRAAVEIKPGSGRIAAGQPAACIATHNIGKIALSVTNKGVFGSGFTGQTGVQDCFTGELVPSLEYPKGSRKKYLFAGCFWIGAVVGKDTLVSVGADGWSSQQEFNPAESPLGDMIYRSIIDPSKAEYEGAVSEQDYVCIYFDTCTNCPGGTELDYLDSRPHVPLNIEVSQVSYAWSYSYAEDFVLFDFSIRNIGAERLCDVFMGLYVDAEVHIEALVGEVGWFDDVTGFVHALPAAFMPQQCPDSDVVNVAWIADNNGDFELAPGWQVPHVTGMRIVRTPSDSLDISYNWWVSNGDATLDFGPQTRAAYRNLGTGGLGTPEGDRNKYHFLSNGEFDYDQVFTASLSPLDEVWTPVNPLVAADLGDGYDTRFLLSFGPFDIEPGQTLPISFAYLAGENLHTNPDNLDNLPENPGTYYDNLDFSDLGLNAIWADWIYDNPGVDTDSDGYAGVADTCNLGGDSTLAGIDTIIDTIAGIVDTTIDTVWIYENFKVVWRKGDGVPDFRGASPPPAPRLWITPREEAIMVRWNGFRSETAIDNFSGKVDFEGYRVYIARDERRSSYTLLQSYDFENYNKWVWDDSVMLAGRLGAFVLRDPPYALRELRCRYAPDSCADSLWDPLAYSRNNPFPVGDSIFYFEPQDFNQSVLGNYPGAMTQIRKRDTSAIKPTAEWIEDTTLIPDSLHDQVLTEDGYFLFYEYEYSIENLLPTIPYWINVTAFDYGSPQSGLSSLETSPTVMPVVTYAQESVESVLADNLKVYVYPNPYRLDAGYRVAGFEGLSDQDRPDDRVRRIHFVNLPPRCTIRIYSIDGDLVREIEHDIDPSDPLANHDTWDLITRNTQLAVSGLYYWTIESPGRKTQVGKVALIM